jgi:hypothetical protein
MIAGISVQPHLSPRSFGISSTYPCGYATRRKVTGSIPDGAICSSGEVNLRTVID